MLTNKHGEKEPANHSLKWIESIVRGHIGYLSHRDILLFTQDISLFLIDFKSHDYFFKFGRCLDYTIIDVSLSDFNK